jgi:predicted NBD/HSP70 family sugar kinase
MNRKILVADIGGTQVKVMMSPKTQIKFDSGEEMRPRDFVERFRESVKGLKFDRISIGFPAPVRHGKIVREPKHLGKGWVGFNFSRALHKPTRLINDAAMQALGSHVRGRILFLGLGTGLGSALVWRNSVLPLELGDLPYHGHRKIETFLGKEGLEKLGRNEWRDEVLYAVEQLKLSFVADTIVLGGGNVQKMNGLPRGIEKGDNRNAYLGGVRLWEIDRRTGQPRWQIL